MKCKKCKRKTKDFIVYEFKKEIYIANTNRKNTTLCALCNQKNYERELKKKG